MKRYVVFFVLAVCLTGALFAQTEDDFDYMQNVSGKITITKYLGWGKGIKDVVIPSKIQGIEVTEIDVAAFANARDYNGTRPHLQTFDSVVIPSTVITIKDRAFEGCGLKSLTIPNSVTSIGRSAFADNNLTEVILPDSVTEIGAYCFTKNKITKITFSNKMKEIPRGAFINNKLSQVIIPEGITTLTGGVGSERMGPFELNKLVYIKLPSSIMTLSVNGRSGNIFAENPITIIDCPKDILGKWEVGRIDADIVALKIGANFQKLDAYEESFRNFYTVQGKKAGVYIKQGRLWRVGTQAEFDKLINDKVAEQEALVEAERQQRAAEQQQRIAEAQQRQAEYLQKQEAEEREAREAEKIREMAPIVSLLADLRGFDAQTFQEFTRIYSEIRQLKIQYPDNRHISRMEQSITQLETKLNKNQKKALDSMLGR